jgi:hypothetical protein
MTSFPPLLYFTCFAIHTTTSSNKLKLQKEIGGDPFQVEREVGMPCIGRLSRFAGNSQGFGGGYYDKFTQMSKAMMPWPDSYTR